MHVEMPLSYSTKGPKARSESPDRNQDKLLKRPKSLKDRKSKDRGNTNIEYSVRKNKETKWAREDEGKGGMDVGITHTVRHPSSYKSFPIN